MKMILTKAPALEPVSLAQIKTRLGADSPRNDTLLSCLVTAARVVLEARTGLLFLSQAWTVQIDRPWGGEGVALPIAPVRRLLSAKLSRHEGGRATRGGAGVRLAANGAGQRLVLDDDWRAAWEQSDAVLEAKLLAGLSDRPGDLPAPIRQAVEDLAVHWFTRREAVSFGDQRASVPHEIAHTLTPFTARALH